MADRGRFIRWERMCHDLALGSADRLPGRGRQQAAGRFGRSGSALRGDRAAAAAEAPDNRFSVEVRVLGSSSLAATLTTADGRKLPEQRFAASDRDLTKDIVRKVRQGPCRRGGESGPLGGRLIH